MINPKVNDGAAIAAEPMPLDALRNATGEYHRKLEAAIDWTGAFQSCAAYRHLLQRFARVVPPLERAIAAQLASDPPPEFDANVRTRWLESDLAQLDLLIGQSPLPGASDSVEDARSPEEASSGGLPATEPDFAFIDCRAAAVGALYVLEGSSLGGQFLSRQLHERLQLEPANGGAYFAAYGAATSEHWQAFRRWANDQLSDPRSTCTAAEAARLTFVRFGNYLAGLPNE